MATPLDRIGRRDDLEAVAYLYDRPTQVPLQPRSRLRFLWRWLGWLLAATVALQLFFAARIALLAYVDPQSTTFQRSELFRLATDAQQPLAWRRQWRPYAQISDHLKRAVIASEDARFARHSGIEWDAIRKAWQRNTEAEQRAAAAEMAAAGADDEAGARAPNKKIYGGSTITQQLAKNLLLSPERSYLRKGQELLLSLLLEALLSKPRILEIYLNNVEWGRGVFGAEAAARHYFKKSAADLTGLEAARLAVMLPRPRYFERLPNSTYLARRARLITRWMETTELP